VKEFISAATTADLIETENVLISQEIKMASPLCDFNPSRLCIGSKYTKKYFREKKGKNIIRRLTQTI
jgi:hypothetical protein